MIRLDGNEYPARHAKRRDHRSSLRRLLWIHALRFSMPATCPSDNTLAVEQERFWDGNWDAHKIGWLISGAAAAVTLFIALITIFGHSLNYHRPSQQRQIIRILFFPPVFAIVSFFSYRFFRSYTYYELVEVIYEAIAIAAFLILMLAYIGDDDISQMRLFATKDKRKMPLPFCCWRYRPSKAYFLILTKWSVVQYCFVRPALSIAGIVLEYYGLLCNDSLSYKYGHVYLLAIDFVSISVALYGLIVLYGLIKDDLQGKRPLSKFMSIKLGIMFIFYQSFVFSILQDLAGHPDLSVMICCCCSGSVTLQHDGRCRNSTIFTTDTFEEDPKVPGEFD